ncbi:MULE domain-containing protein [Trichonephila clavipes]|nr:MULE domain-containing protein [Trichonephila clavipes]
MKQSPNRSLLEERDIHTFQSLTEAAVKFFKEDPDTVEFSNYFETYYLPDTSSWAYCYRLHSGINTNMHIERMHHTLKYIYLHGKNVKRLDKAIYGIMGFNLGGRTGTILRLSSVPLKSKKQEINRLQLAVKLPWAIFFESVDILS